MFDLNKLLNFHDEFHKTNPDEIKKKGHVYRRIWKGWSLDENSNDLGFFFVNKDKDTI